MRKLGMLLLMLLVALPLAAQVRTGPISGFVYEDSDDKPARCFMFHTAGDNDYLVGGAVQQDVATAPILCILNKKVD